MSEKPANFSYMTEDEIKNLMRMAMPRQFDASGIKNKFTDIQYGTLPEHKLDLYLPDEGDGPFPLIIYVHGGGWSMGTKTLCALDGIIGARRRGYAIMSVDYRLAPPGCFPDFIWDVKTAVRWARANADKYGLDGGHFGMVGDSAGGHITLMIGFTADHPEYEGEEYGWKGYSSAVQAICDMYGPADLSADEDEWYAQSKVKRLAPPPKEGPTTYEMSFGTGKKSLLRLISPISYVHKDIPPTMIQQGMKDAVVAYQHSTTLADKIKEVCGEDRVLLRTYPERNHSDAEFMTEENCREVLAFFDKYLK